MFEAYLFDWGDTLMVDFPNMPGKMCDWPEVEAIDGALEALNYLSQRSRVYVATGAAESTEAEIEQAFTRVELNRFISGYFCKANLGVAKGSTEFLPLIVQQLGLPHERIAMVGDSLIKDILPAAAAGIRPIWLTQSPEGEPSGTKIIGHLAELCS